MQECQKLEQATEKIQWVNRRVANISELQPAGLEKYICSGLVNHRIYVARAYYSIKTKGTNKVGILPGKYTEGDVYIYFSYQGEEHLTTDGELLQFPSGSVSWVSIEGVTNHTKYILGCVDPETSNLLYICRYTLMEYKLLVTGYMSQEDKNDKICFVEEQKRSEFEILTLNAYGSTIEAERKYLYMAYC